MPPLQGTSFSGWQRQPAGTTKYPTVAGEISDSLAPLLRFKGENGEGKGKGKRTEKGKGKGKGKGSESEWVPHVTVAGRTDSQVSAFGQVCSVHTWDQNITVSHISDAISGCPAAERGDLTVHRVQLVPRRWHPQVNGDPPTSHHRPTDSSAHRPIGPSAHWPTRPPARPL